MVPSEAPNQSYFQDGVSVFLLSFTRENPKILDSILEHSELSSFEKLAYKIYLDVITPGDAGKIRNLCIFESNLCV